MIIYERRRTPDAERKRKSRERGKGRQRGGLSTAQALKIDLYVKESSAALCALNLCQPLTQRQMELLAPLLEQMRLSAETPTQSDATLVISPAPIPLAA